MSHEPKRGVNNANLQRAQFRKVGDTWQRRLPGGPWETLQVTVEVIRVKNGHGRRGQQKMRTIEERVWEWVWGRVSAKLRPARDRFDEKVQIDQTSGCWVWTGCCDSAGYGIFQVESTRTVKAHRFSYELHQGPIPTGLVIDHLCRVRNCVNPAHLRPCTDRENIHAEKSECLAAINAAKTHCPKGHPYDDRNTYVCPQGRRHCRACKREVERRRAPRKR